MTTLSGFSSSEKDFLIYFLFNACFQVRTPVCRIELIRGLYRTLARRNRNGLVNLALCLPFMFVLRSPRRKFRFAGRAWSKTRRILRHAESCLDEGGIPIYIRMPFRIRPADSNGQHGNPGLLVCARRMYGGMQA